MLPLLPALILLLLQGPSNIERMAGDGGLPAALGAVSQRAEANHRSCAKADEVLLASLLASSGDRSFSHALIALLQMSGDTLLAEEPNSRPEASAERLNPPETPPKIGEPTGGFITCQRSRDGPF